MSNAEDFAATRRRHLSNLAGDAALSQLGTSFVEQAGRAGYSYNFDWLGLPIIQFPADVVAVQEIIWRVKPEVVVETGIARGGSLALSASLLELLGGDRFVVGIDIDIRPANRAALEGHPLASRMRLMEGSSTDESVFAEVRDLVEGRAPVVVLLDSMHTHDHVAAELSLYAPLVTPGSYLVVFDTVIEDMPADYFPDRPWGRGNSPRTAVDAFLTQTDEFVLDEEYEHKLLATVAKGGYLRRVAR